MEFCTYHCVWGSAHAIPLPLVFFSLLHPSVASLAPWNLFWVSEFIPWRRLCFIPWPRQVRLPSCEFPQMSTDPLHWSWWIKRWPPWSVSRSKMFPGGVVPDPSPLSSPGPAQCQAYRRCSLNMCSKDKLVFWHRTLSSAHFIFLTLIINRLAYSFILCVSITLSQPVFFVCLCLRNDHNASFLAPNPCSESYQGVGSISPPPWISAGLPTNNMQPIDCGWLCINSGSLACFHCSLGTVLQLLHGQARASLLGDEGHNTPASPSPHPTAFQTCDWDHGRLASPSTPPGTLAALVSPEEISWARPRPVDTPSLTNSPESSKKALLFQPLCVKVVSYSTSWNFS